MSNARAAEPLGLAQGGRTAFRIVVADDATEAEQYAAEELASTLRKLSGATFPVATAPGNGPSIRLRHDPDLGGREPGGQGGDFLR